MYDCWSGLSISKKDDHLTFSKKQTPHQDLTLRGESCSFNISIISNLTRGVFLSNLLVKMVPIIKQMPNPSLDLLYYRCCNTSTILFL